MSGQGGVSGGGHGVSGGGGVSADFLARRRN